jgi:hypothetical protein
MCCVDIGHGRSVEYPLGFALSDESSDRLTVFKAQILRRRDHIPMANGGLAEKFRAQLATLSEYNYTHQLQSLPSLAPQAYAKV